MKNRNELDIGCLSLRNIYSYRFLIKWRAIQGLPNKVIDI